MTKNCCKKQGKNFSIDNVIEFLKVVSVKNRACIICLLQKKERCVCEINEALNLSQNLVSHHLKVLKEKGIIKSRKEGVNIFYSLNEKKLKKHKEIINKFL